MRVIDVMNNSSMFHFFGLAMFHQNVITGPSDYFLVTYAELLQIFVSASLCPVHLSLLVLRAMPRPQNPPSDILHKGHKQYRRNYLLLLPFHCDFIVNVKCHLQPILLYFDEKKSPV